MKIYEINGSFMEAFLQKILPDKYAIVVYCYFDDIDLYDYTLNKLEEITGEKELCMTQIINNGFVIIECDSKEEAYKIYNEFPEEKADYCILFGKIDINYTKNINQASIDYLNSLKEKYPNGMILTENT